MYINVNGIRLYYEEYGEGMPLIMLHGNGESLKIFKEVITPLAKDYKVILVDSRGHGKSSKCRRLDYNIMAKDIIALIEKLALNKPIIYGFSDGGIIALKIAIMRPNLLNKIIISGANINPKGLNDKLIKRGKIIHFFTRSKLWRLMLEEPNISLEELNKINIEVNILAGENDCIKPEHTKLIKDNIKNATLEIIKGANHSSYVIKNKELYDILIRYLKK